MDSIKDIIPTVIGKISQQTPDAAKNLNAVWTRISGGSGSRIVNSKNGTLTVHVDSAMRMVNLNVRKDALIEELQKDFSFVKWIHFKVAKM